MSKVILCTGRMASNGWLLPDGLKAYSVEELCYYVYQNIYGLEDGFFTKELSDWLERECQMPETAEKLEWLRSEGHGTKDLTIALLCSADYYTEPEIKELLVRMNELEQLPPWKKRKRLADEYLHRGQYARAGSEYEKILAEHALTEEERGNIMHNIGVVRMYTISVADAAESFYAAYKLWHHPESMKLCLLAYRMGHCQEEYQKVLAEEGISQEFIQMTEEEWSESAAEADNSGQGKLLREILQGRRAGMVAESYEGLNGLLEVWKQEYRNALQSYGMIR